MKKKKVTVLGGGTGISFLLKGLKELPLDITAVITVADDGRSTGKLRKEFSTPAVGDIRQVLSNLSNHPLELKNLMEYRFNTYSDLNGHPIGNLLLTALLNQNNSLKQSIEYLSTLLNVEHKVLPLSEDYLTLVADTVDGDQIIGQENINNSHKKYQNIYYQEEPHVLKEVIMAIQEADLLIISMGSLYTSIMPHLICRDVIKAIDKSSAKIMYICNLMTQPGEIDDCHLSDYIKRINEYLNLKKIDVVIANNQLISKTMLIKYESEAKEPIKIDKENIKKIAVKLIESNLITLDDGTIKHDSLKLCSLIFSYLMGC